MSSLIEVNNTTLNVNFYGTSANFPLVLIHGNGENSTYFKHQIEHFKSKYYIIAVDTRAHGKSSYNNETLSTKLFAKDIIALMEKLNIKKANFLGFSDGGNILLHMAMLNPEIINKMVVNGANLDVKGVKLGTNILTYFGYYLVKFIAKFDKKAIQKREILGLMVKNQELYRKDISNIKTETLVIAGTNDLIKEKHTREIASLLENSKLEFVKGSHFALYQNPTDFNKVVEEFLG